MNWWDFVNVLLFLLAQHTVRFFFSKQYYYDFYLYSYFH